MEEKLDDLESAWDRITADADAIPVPDWHRDVLNERLKDLDATPDAGESWDVVQERLRASLKKQHETHAEQAHRIPSRRARCTRAISCLRAHVMQRALR